MYTRILLAVVAVLVIASPVVRADDQSLPLLNDDQIALIKANCAAVQANLTRIHANDVLSRVHLGQEYETISTNFMAPMNSRVALTKLSGVALVKTTADFNTQLDQFHSQYQQYVQTVMDAIQMKCTDQPVVFYDTILSAQTYRSKVRDTVTTLASLTSQYSDEVNALRAQLVANPDLAKGSQ